MRHKSYILTLLFLLSTAWLSGCRTSTETTSTTRDGFNPLAPERVDVRGIITMSRYREGQIILEVEGRGPSTYSRYDRAYVLVLPTTDIVGLDGKSVYMNELLQGVNVAIMLRGRGKGEFEGVGVATKIWIEEFY
ncbi:hypothetical protein H7F15_06235 [Pontibacter sp. Tf4]|uniref:hypothetical protein n=1 Tax=Pontibacter sp. Tf4 TaxID=2761620 RepID=UPI001625EC38|nr:hypothetical protein [Pontibacter sp. Tf4]MBB6610627.1 hypothetical protein [Pontibacter sp. Tf4]